MIRVKIKNTTLYKVPVAKDTFVCFRNKLTKEGFEDIILNHIGKRVIIIG